MSILDNVTRIKDKEEFMRLTAVELSVITEEQLAKARKTAEANGTTLPLPRARLHLTWEPLSYTFKGPNGNVAHDYIDVSYGFDFEILDRVRELGWLGIPDNKLIRVNDKVGPEAQDREWPRWRLKTRDILHIDIDETGTITGRKGQPYSTSIGHVFRVTEGRDYFPRNIQVDGVWKRATEPREVYVRYPVEDVTDTYVQPENVPTRMPRTPIESTEVSPSAVSGGISDDAIRLAFVESGLVGTPAGDFNTMVKQVNFLSRHMGDSDNTLILGTGELNAKANDGDLLDYLVSKGIVSIDDGGIIR